MVHWQYMVGFITIVVAPHCCRFVHNMGCAQADFALMCSTCTTEPTAAIHLPATSTL
jgi:hypothetical protein